MLTLFFTVCWLQGWSQKKMHPVTISAMTGISLPEGTKRDTRVVSVLSCKVLLEMESKPAGTGIDKMEILELPPVSASGFTADTLVARLAAQGWNIVQVNEDDKFVWLQKENNLLMAYFAVNPKSCALYFGTPQNQPALLPQEQE